MGEQMEIWIVRWQGRYISGWTGGRMDGCMSGQVAG